MRPVPRPLSHQPMAAEVDLARPADASSQALARQMRLVRMHLHRTEAELRALRRSCERDARVLGRLMRVGIVLWFGGLALSACALACALVWV